MDIRSTNTAQLTVPTTAQSEDADQANTAVTTDGFKNDGQDKATPLDGEGIAVSTGNEAQAKKKGDKSAKFADWDQVDESAKKAQQDRKTDEAAGEGQEGEGEDKKEKGDAQ